MDDAWMTKGTSGASVPYHPLDFHRSNIFYLWQGSAIETIYDVLYTSLVCLPCVNATARLTNCQVHHDVLPAAVWAIGSSIR